ncbi:hypothetical protein GCM10025865_23080 [Paraoerskovia sediminicola]|uniref:Peptidase S9A N-terminal domain-containing protein n=1 Tax=Paraoerskovia sediminicola TaxID=1138587 RepID=A0ABN6XDU2_9CELL|nr:hypothetical protein GCM10025865_23080 [Paraoerskovia sediminicola]
MPSQPIVPPETEHRAASADPWEWLEDVDGPRALEWVRARNADTATDLASTRSFEHTRARTREILDSDAKIPAAAWAGGLLYNFWRDGDHPRGVWRRTTPESYRTDAPEWETVLDLDALSADEGESWVWHGASILRPDCRRALVSLSPGGSDADVTRELDLVDLRFVPPEEGGFHRPLAKGGLGWIDHDTVFVQTDLGPGTTTTSGYPRTARRWRRGTPLAEAETVFEGREDDLYIAAAHLRTPGFERDVVHRSIDFYTGDLYLLDHPTDPTNPAGAVGAVDGGDAPGLVHVDVPASAEAGIRRDLLVVELRDDWDLRREGGALHPAGSLLATDLDEFLAGDRRLTVLFAPTPSTSLAGATWTRSHLVLTVLDDVRTRLVVLTPPTPDQAGAEHPTRAATSDTPTGWRERAVTGLPELGTVGVRALETDESDDVWLTVTDHLTPTTLALLAIPADGPVDAGLADPLKASPAGSTRAAWCRGSTSRCRTTARGSRTSSSVGRTSWTGPRAQPAHPGQATVQMTVQMTVRVIGRARVRASERAPRPCSTGTAGSRSR